MFVAINPTPKNATVQPDWHGKRLAWIPTTKRKPKFWQLLIEAGLFKVDPELRDKLFNHLAEVETVERLTIALQENKIFLAELVKCPTFGEKDLDEHIVETCSNAYLTKEIQVVSPRIVCSWGRLSFATLTESTERLGDVINGLDRKKKLRIGDLPLTTKGFGSVPCYPCYFHLQAPVTDEDKIRHLKRLRTILRS